MQYIRMSYKNFTFWVNPSTLKISHRRVVSSRSIPFGASRSREISMSPVVISGQGVFAGDDARDNARDITRIFDEKGSGYLFLPDSTPVKAIFSRLDVSYRDTDGSIVYDFEFVQENPSKSASFDFGFTYAKAGENLYDVSNRTSVGVDRLFELNSYKDLFSIQEGDKIWIS